MDASELAWRGRAAARVMRERARHAIAREQWNRKALGRILGPSAAWTAVRDAVAGGRWLDAHVGLARHVASSPQRFLVAPRVRPDVLRRVTSQFPDAAGEAAVRANRILGGDYDLLGYRGLRFPGLDWHFDPVHDRRPPRRFWADVPYLDPACGDHKIIWELNRHQHWLALGRAYWLTGDRRYRDHVVAQLYSWLDANPPLAGVNWASMLELGLRCVSWLWAVGFFAEPDAADESPWLVDLLVALDRQLTHVERHLSYYFSPNTHLLGEGLALYVAGRALPCLDASPRREAIGRRILMGEIERQVLSDGGHCERSMHYHRYALDFCLMALAVARITRDGVATELEHAAARLADAARLLADDAGRLPHLGDDDAGALVPIAGRPADDARDSLAVAAALVGHPNLRVGPTPEEALWWLAHPSLAIALELSCAAPRRTRPRSRALPATGYYVSRSAAGDHLVIDAGPHGYMNAGHSHADALSLTFAARGIPLLIDPGTACYTTDGELRDRFRSTALHNTATIDSRPQSVPLGPFHWARTADAAARRWHMAAGFDYFDGVHDGYRPLEHRRHVLVVHEDLAIVADLFDGGGAHKAAVHWHIDPRWRLDPGARHATMSTAGGWAEIAIPAGTLEPFTADDATGLGWHSPAYGRVEPATTLRIVAEANTPFWIVTVFGLDPDNQMLAVESLPVWAEAGVLQRSTALRIERTEAVDYFLVAHPTEGRKASWRVAEIETDARVLYGRLHRNRAFTLVACVDGTYARFGDREIAVGRTSCDERAARWG